MKVLNSSAFITGTVETGLEYNIKKVPYEDFWQNQKDRRKGLFISEPCPIFPFSDTILVSKGFYDFAHIPSTLNTIFVSQKMLEVFALLNMPKFQYWPIQYKVRGKMYEGYWLAFYHD